MTKPMNKIKVGIIGGGAAGMMAACAAAEYGAEVTLFEKNKYLGKKLGITGKGRCNVTNNCTAEEFIASIVSNSKFMYTAANAFTAQDTMSFFEKEGVALKTERGNRVFPQDDKAKTIVDALRRRVQADCTVVNEEVLDIICKNGESEGIRTARGEYPFDSVIVCTGGLSYPLTGSTGDGYRMAQKLGIAVTELAPSLVPLETVEGYCAKMQGLSLKNVAVTVTDTVKNSVIYRDFGEMMFTHFGVTGPVILSASAHMKNMTEGRYKISIDLKPALDEKQLDARLLRDFGENINRDFSNILSGLLPSKMIPVFVAKSGIAGDKKANSITKEERRAVISLLKAFEVTVKRARKIDEAIITRGGIDVKELSPKTMESKKVARLFFAGEVLDLDAYTGGFNLQIAFSTATLAGRSAATVEPKDE